MKLLRRGGSGKGQGYQVHLYRRIACVNHVVLAGHTERKLLPKANTYFPRTIYGVTDVDALAIAHLP